MNTQTAIRLGVRRAIILFLISLVLVWAVSEGAYWLQRDKSDRAPRQIVMVIPEGTAASISAGQPVPSIPEEMVFVVGDTLVVQNNDISDHQLGPLWVPAGTSASLVMDQANRYEWMNSWTLNPQLHSAMKVIQDTQGIEVSAAIVQGLYKGYESYGKQTSPFCYAYARAGQPPFYEPELSYIYKAGYQKFPVWELERGGVKKWVDEMPQDLLMEQFPTVPPVFYNPSIADAFFRQALHREREIEMALEMLEHTEDPDSRQNIMDLTFPQNFEACAPSALERLVHS